MGLFLLFQIYNKKELLVKNWNKFINGKLEEVIAWVGCPIMVDKIRQE